MKNIRNLMIIAGLIQIISVSAQSQDIAAQEKATQEKMIQQNKAMQEQMNQEVKKALTIAYNAEVKALTDQYNQAEAIFTQVSSAPLIPQGLVQGIHAQAKEKYNQELENLNKKYAGRL